MKPKKKRARKPTYKRIAGRKVQTNKLWRNDRLELPPGEVFVKGWDRAFDVLEKAHGLALRLGERSVNLAYWAGIARGRALATASGKKMVKN